MDQVRTIAKNASVVSFSNIASRGLDFVYFIIIARYLGVEGFGILSTGLAFVGLFTVILNFGFNPVIIREVSKFKEETDKYLANVLSFRILIAIPVILLVFALSKLLNYTEIVSIVILVLIGYMFLLSINETFYALYQAHERMEYFSLGRLLESSFKLGLTFLFVVLGFNVVEFALLYVIVILVVLIINLGLFSTKFTTPKLELDYPFLKKALKMALPFAPSGILVKIYTDIDKVMLSKLVINGTEAVGIYNAPNRLVMGIVGIIRPITIATYPVISKLVVNSEKTTVVFAYSRLFKYLMILSLPLGVIITALSSKLIITLFGKEYINSIPILQILIWFFVLSALSWPFGTLLKSIDKQIENLKRSTLEVVVNIISNLLLIPTYSYTGAAIATLITSIVGLTYLNYTTIKLGYRLEGVSISKVMLSTIIMGGIIYSLAENILIAICIGILIYIISLIILNVFDAWDKQAIKRLEIPLVSKLIKE